MNFPSKLVEKAVGEVSKLPGIGKKTALRLVLHLLKQPETYTSDLSRALSVLRKDITYCKQCHAISDEEICNICSSQKRDRSIICVVVDMPDLLAIENTAQYQGLYHVLGGVISPIEGIGADDLNIDSLFERVGNGITQEVILALPATMEGDTTAFYLTRRLKESDVTISTLSRGVPIGNELEYTDEVTLGRSIIGRVSFD